MNKPATSNASVRFVTISPEQAGQRIDNFLLRELKGVPRSVIYRILRKGEVRVNKGRIKAVYRLKAGDSIRIPPVRVAPERQQAVVSDTNRERLQNAVIHEDRDLLVLDKPAGLAVHAGSGIRSGIIEMLRVMRPELEYLELVHRLDRETSGCLLLAKNREALTALHEQMQQHAFDKRYLALVAGPWHNEGDRTVNEPLERIQRGGERMVEISRGGKAAVSHMYPVSKYRDSTLLEIRIETGRTHQIRVHCASIEHPLAGDEKYGDRDFNARMKKLGLKRLFLHAHSLSFTHPRSGEPMHLSVPLGQELQQVLTLLEAG
jgi:23S rRNA pseudouridine955/2504/2580 synthase